MSSKVDESAKTANSRLWDTDPDMDIVISGISGAFPESNNVQEFQENLFAKKNMVTPGDRRCNPEFEKRTYYMGKLKEINRFDAGFFGIPSKLAEYLDPGSRILLEKTYEAIVDAGYNPKHFSGSNTGVFVSNVWAPLSNVLLEPDLKVDRYTVDQVCTALVANRISFWLNTRGPSFTVDCACSSSLQALDLAYNAMRLGHCDSAIVGATNVSLISPLNDFFAHLGVISNDDATRSFDNEGNGFLRSESVAVILLQRKKDARRMYARLVHTKTNCDGYKKEGIHEPSTKSLKNLLTEFYQECRVSPKNVKLMEAHAAATKVGDSAELKAIQAIMGQSEESLMLGSVKSNMGHSESAAGLCSIIKVLISFESGIIPPTLHYRTPRAGIQSLQNEEIKVITEPTPWNVGLAAINNLGFGGTNCHALLEPNPKVKSEKCSLRELPLLVTASGRTEEAVDLIFEDLERTPLDMEYVGLLHEIYKEPVSNHLHRGFVVLHEDQGIVTKEIKTFSGQERPIYFVFSGMGSQWTGMGKSLMKIPVVAESIRMSQTTLESKGVDLIKIIAETDLEDQNDTDGLMNASVGIVAIQIALTDLLRKIGIEPSGILGHSLGEISCAYADDCITAEQAILLAYYRGAILSKYRSINGSMASVGRGHHEVENLKPPEIDIACHNTHENCTISGPSAIIDEFMKTMDKDIFIREVPSYRLAAHSRYTKDAASILKNALSDVIKEPKLRSTKWISSSFLYENWDTDAAKYCSAEYYTQNMTGVVYFEEACYEISNNALVIEIAPNGLLQSLLKRSLKQNAAIIPLTSKYHRDNSVHVLKALGGIYTVGCNFYASKLYPPVEFPVSRGTRMISPLVKWDHEHEWHVYQDDKYHDIRKGTRKVTVSLEDEQYKYFEHHVANGQNLYPGVGYLILAWETLGFLLQKPYTELPVVFEDVRFLKMLMLPQKGSVVLSVNVSKNENNFVITESGNVVANGRIRVLQTEEIESSQFTLKQDGGVDDDDDELPLTNTDIYKELLLRGYECKGPFRGLTHFNQKGTVGRVSWNNNFLTFIDSVLQMNILIRPERTLLIPNSIRKLTINTKEHFQILNNLNSENPEFVANINREIDVIKCGGLETQKVQFMPISRREPIENLWIKKLEFVPYIKPQLLRYLSLKVTVNKYLSDQICEPLQFEHQENFISELPDLPTAISICVQIFAENIKDNPVKIVELVDHFTNLADPLMSQLVLEAYHNTPIIEPNISITCDKIDLSEIIKEQEISVTNTPLPCDESCSIVIASHISQRDEILRDCIDSMKTQGFLLIRETNSENRAFENLNLHVCFEFTFHNERVLVLRKFRNFGAGKPIIVKINEGSYSWIAELQKWYNFLRVDENQLLILLAEKVDISGIIGFARSFRQEIQHENMKCFYIIDESAPPFTIDHPLYKEQIKNHLLINVYKNREWCGYYGLPFDKPNVVPVPHAYVNVLSPGDLRTIKWMEGPLNPECYQHAKKELIHVYSAALNFKDVALATRILPSEIFDSDCHVENGLLGFEFAGKTDDGRRFMGMVASRGTANLVECDSTRMWSVPDTWTLEDAATVPVAYSTVLYALLECGRLKNGDSILIHSAAGGVGLAALNVALYYNCEIFVTVGTPEKREFILQNYPTIPENHIGNSRDTTFENMILKTTNGKGVRFVLNSLSGDKLHASIRCLAAQGHFLELGKLDFISDGFLDMRHFLNKISFHTIDMTTFVYDEHVQQIVHPLMQKAIDNKMVKPLARNIFLPREIEAAYRYLASGKNIGKVLIKIRDEEVSRNCRPNTLFMDAMPRYICRAEKSYIICGGLGGFGLELANWLTIRGAKNIILSSRSMPYNGYQVSRIRLWRSHGTNVIVSTDDISTEEGVKRLLQTANSVGTVSAIFNVAAVLSYRSFNNETEESFSRNAIPKDIATSHLDKLSRQLCPHLEHFVVFSSMAAYLGAATQTSYTMSNSFVERICEKRKAENLPALAIVWGAIAEVGIIAERMGFESNVALLGLAQQNIQSCLRILETFLTQSNAVVGCGVVKSKKKIEITNKTISEVVANILGIQNLKAINIYAPLTEFGLDSLHSVEIKNVFEREFTIYLTNEEIKELTFTHLYKMDADRNTTQWNKINHTKESESSLDPGFAYLKEIFENFKMRSDIVVRMPSLLHNGDTNEVSARQYPTVFFLPGLDGFARYSEEFSRQLNVQVLCLEYDMVNVPDTIEEHSKQLAQEIDKRLEPDQEFWIIGYSYGACLALETARQLEDMGRVGRVWLIDASTETQDMQAIVKNEKLMERLSQELFNKVIGTDSIYVKELWPKTVEMGRKMLADSDSPFEFTENVHKLLDPEMVKRIEEECEDMPIFANALYKRFQLMLKHERMTRKSIKSTVTLLKATHSLSEFGQTLQQYLQQPLRVHVIEGDHFTVIKNKSASKVINEDFAELLRNQRKRNTKAAGNENARSSIVQ